MVCKDKKIVFYSLQVLLYFNSSIICFCTTYFERVFLWMNSSPKTNSVSREFESPWWFGHLLMCIIFSILVHQSFALNKDFKWINNNVCVIILCSSEIAWQLETRWNIYISSFIDIVKDGVGHVKTQQKTNSCLTNVCWSFQAKKQAVRKSSCTSACVCEHIT